MKNFLIKTSKFLMRHMWLYYLLNYTWGILTTFAGWIAYLFVLSFRKKIIEKGKFGPANYIMLGNNWGGFSLGMNFFVADEMGEEYTLHTKEHETGHTFQNAIFGPFVLFLVTIPSVIRYWYQVNREKKGLPNKEYDAIWFEGSASEIGEVYYELFGNN